MSSTTGDLFWAIIRNFGSRRMNREMKGFTLEREIGVVNRDEALAYARATRDDNPLYAEEGGYAPPFYVAKLVFPSVKDIFVHKELKMNLLKMVHGEQQIIWHKPVKIGDSLSLKILIEDIADNPVGEMLTIRGEIYRGTELIAEALTGSLVRGGKKAGGKEKKAEMEPPSEAFRLEIQTEEGQQLEYAEASGDTNFIHTSQFLAKLAGLPRTIMHGVCVMAMGCNSLTQKLIDGDVRRLAAIDGRFSLPALPGQKLTLIAFPPQEEGQYEFTILNPSGKPVIKNGYFRHR